MCCVRGLPRSAATRPKPSISGMSTSVMTMSGQQFSSCLSASTPSTAVSTWNSCELSRRLDFTRTIFESSTSMTSVCAAVFRTVAMAGFAGAATGRASGVVFSTAAGRVADGAVTLGVVRSTGGVGNWVAGSVDASAAASAALARRSASARATFCAFWIAALRRACSAAMTRSAFARALARAASTSVAAVVAAAVGVASGTGAAGCCASLRAVSRALRVADSRSACDCSWRRRAATNRQAPMAAARTAQSAMRM